MFALERRSVCECVFVCVLGAGWGSRGSPEYHVCARLFLLILSSHLTNRLQARFEIISTAHGGFRTINSQTCSYEFKFRQLLT